MIVYFSADDDDINPENDSENHWRHYENPKDWQNTLNLALYHVAANQPDTAQTLYQQALSQNAPTDKIRKAIRNLQEFLIVFPSNSLAQQTIDLLQQSSDSETHDS
ncbi:MAG TPA: hypothetical protein IGS17_16840 [Oscillatoriales cyanobacterium M59_W2019_021]|nr:MAG: hypothetical protein D6728_02780 [Cyanobacteria bacterium J055]HIK32961.1 hypothetical protein [Oscillatoriales cyanobacterium M4454_W2019_049]HIK52573.1 hypothetical protein [Oscillatoriales cyanobacterium M59_W2019_021]